MILKKLKGGRWTYDLKVYIYGRSTDVLSVLP